MAPLAPLGERGGIERFQRPAQRSGIVRWEAHPVTAALEDVARLGYRLNFKQHRVCVAPAFTVA